MKTTPEYQAMSRAERIRLRPKIIQALRGNLENAVPPKNNETVAVTVSNKKTAALFFDKLWRPPGEADDRFPQELLAYGATDIEIWSAALSFMASAPNYSTEVDLDLFFSEFLRNTSDNPEIALAYKKNTPMERAISDILRGKLGFNSIPVYVDSNRRDIEFTPGNYSTIVASINDLNIIDEDKLSWQQVLEFRRDPEAKLKLRRLRSWADNSLSGKSISQISDIIAVKLDDYEWSTKKHGISTINGCISDLIDPRFLGGLGVGAGALSLAGQGWIGAIAAAGLTVGRATLSIRQRMIDMRDQDRAAQSEVAFVHELRKL